MTACPDQETALHALTDGELDTLATIALEAHLRGCAGCRSALARLEALRAAIRTPGVHPAPPPALRAKVAALAPARPSAHPAWCSFAGGGVFGALAASLVEGRNTNVVGACRLVGVWETRSSYAGSSAGADPRTVFPGQ